MRTRGARAEFVPGKVQRGSPTLQKIMAGGEGICPWALEQDGIWAEPGLALLGGITQQDPDSSAKNALILNTASAAGAAGSGATSRVAEG